MKKNSFFDYFAEIFYKKDHNLFMIGSASRDFLLEREINDYDFVTDAFPEEIVEILKDFKLDLSFIKYGVLKVKYENKTFEFVSMRYESDYSDSRHPQKIIFVRDIYTDAKRRDFTINCIYINKDYKIIDPYNGVKDLNDKIIRTIGDPYIRINEDPLRILRAERFKKEYGFAYEINLEKVILQNQDLIKKLNPEKVKSELKKMEKFI